MRSRLVSLCPSLKTASPKRNVFLKACVAQGVRSSREAGTRSWLGANPRRNIWRVRGATSIRDPHEGGGGAKHKIPKSEEAVRTKPKPDPLGTQVRLRRIKQRRWHRFPAKSKHCEVESGWILSTHPSSDFGSVCPTFQLNPLRPNNQLQQRN